VSRSTAPVAAGAVVAAATAAATEVADERAVQGEAMQQPVSTMRGQEGGATRG
jgi:hypothetical protein